MDFDTPVNRRDTHCVKWDSMEQIYGVPKDDGIAMWVADMEFQAADPIRAAVQGMIDHGVIGYYGEDGAYREAIRWWMDTRHGWQLDPAHIFTTHGLVHGTAMCVDAFTAPGEAVLLMTPVYHAFARVIEAADRRVVELELTNDDGRYTMDTAAWDSLVPNDARMLILCSPHNPGGRVWTRKELEEVADFARRHDLVLVSDEIHHDLVFPGQTHTPMALIDGIADRLVMMTATTKTFNIAGSHTGNVIIADPDLRARFARRMAGLGISPNSFGLFMTTAAYSPEGAEWVDKVRLYLDENRRIFDEGVNAIPGVHSMPLEATYLAWVDFSGTGMKREDFTQRVERDAQIAANHGPTFGTGGADFLRFNFAAPRAQVEDAVARLQAAFGDLQ